MEFLIFLLLCAELVASSVSSNTTGLDMASILQNKLGQKDLEDIGEQNCHTIEKRVLFLSIDFLRLVCFSEKTIVF